MRSLKGINFTSIHFNKSKMKIISIICRLIYRFLLYKKLEMMQLSSQVTKFPSLGGSANATLPPLFAVESLVDQT